MSEPSIEVSIERLAVDVVAQEFDAQCRISDPLIEVSIERLAVDVSLIETAIEVSTGMLL